MNPDCTIYCDPFSPSGKPLASTLRSDSGLSTGETARSISRLRQSVASWDLGLKLKRLAGKKRSRDETDDGEVSTRPKQRARIENAPRIVLPVLNEPTFQVDFTKNAAGKRSKALEEEYEASCAWFTVQMRNSSFSSIRMPATPIRDAVIDSRSPQGSTMGTSTADSHTRSRKSKVDSPACSSSTKSRLPPYVNEEALAALEGRTDRAVSLTPSSAGITWIEEEMEEFRTFIDFLGPTISDNRENEGTILDNLNEAAPGSLGSEISQTEFTDVTLNDM